MVLLTIYRVMSNQGTPTKVWVKFGIAFVLLFLTIVFAFGAMAHAHATQLRYHPGFAPTGIPGYTSPEKADQTETKDNFLYRISLQRELDFILHPTDLANPSILNLYDPVLVRIH